MEALKTAASAICCGMVAMGVFKLLVPDGKMKRSAEIAFSVATVLVLILPLSRGIRFGGGVEYKPALRTELENRTNEQIITLGSRQVERAVGSMLESASVKYSKIEADMDISESGGISIKYVKIKATDQKSKENIIALVSAGMSIDPQRVEVEDE